MDELCKYLRHNWNQYLQEERGQVPYAAFLTRIRQIEFDEKNLLDAFRLESGIKSAREKLQQIIQAKKTLEYLEIALAQIEGRKMEEVGKRAKTEAEIQKIIEGKDKEITKETKARKKAERKVQDLLEKLNTCESLLKAQIESHLSECKTYPSSDRNYTSF